MPDETAMTATQSAPWSDFIGCEVRWAWRLTNQQGYDDGARLEFHDSTSGVDLIVVASCIKLFRYLSVN